MSLYNINPTVLQCVESFYHNTPANATGRDCVRSCFYQTGDTMPAIKLVQDAIRIVGSESMYMGGFYIRRLTLPLLAVGTGATMLYLSMKGNFRGRRDLCSRVVSVALGVCAGMHGIIAVGSLWGWGAFVYTDYACRTVQAMRA